MKTGLFFGSFNPIHIGHVALANYMVEFTDMDQLWFVISPHNPLKKKATLLTDSMRLEMVELAIKGEDRFSVCDIEFRMPQPSYTIDTLTYLQEKYPKHKFILIMGADGLQTFHKWKNQDIIVKNYHRFVYPRHTNPDIDLSEHKNVTLLTEAPKIEVSSSFIRSALKDNKDVRHFLPPAVFEYIDKYNLYNNFSST